MPLFFGKRSEYCSLNHLPKLVPSGILIKSNHRVFKDGHVIKKLLSIELDIRSLNINDLIGTLVSLSYAFQFALKQSDNAPYFFR